MKRSVEAGKPFYAYVPFTLVHYPTLPHPDFAGKTGYGDFADSLAEMDTTSGEILDAVDELGIADDTIVVFTSDNGPEEMLAVARLGRALGGLLLHRHGRLAARAVHHPLAGPGASRARQQRDRARGRHLHDLRAHRRRGDAARTASSTASTRADFLLGKQEKSNREGFPCSWPTRCTR